MLIRIVFADAFTDKPFSGNPAAVCLLEKPAEEHWMQSLAAEIGFSETAFVLRRTEDFALRWFTPACEVSLCGHATLAAAHILWQEGWLPADCQAIFQTASGRLTARQTPEGIQMDFPSEPPKPIAVSKGLSVALGAEPKWVGRNRMDILIEVDDAATVRNLLPDMVLLEEFDTRCVIVTAASDMPEYDFISRCFGPRAGIDEDPVTGSAHCCLGPYWQTRLGKNDFTAYQASQRGGTLGVSVRGSRVLLTGRVVTILRGELLI